MKKRFDQFSVKYIAYGRQKLFNPCTCYQKKKFNPCTYLLYIMYSTKLIFIVLKDTMLRIRIVKKYNNFTKTKQT